MPWQGGHGLSAEAQAHLLRQCCAAETQDQVPTVSPALQKSAKKPELATAVESGCLCWKLVEGCRISLRGLQRTSSIRKTEPCCSMPLSVPVQGRMCHFCSLPECHPTCLRLRRSR